MKNLYIDFDGVIMDTINITYDMLKELGVKEDDKEGISKFYRELDWKYLLSVTEDINDGLKKIQKIIDSNKFNIAILTHVNSLDEAVEKVKFIRKYYKDITIIPVPKAIAKTKMVHTKDSILIDDYSGNLREWEKEGGIGIRFSLTLDGKGYKVIDSLDKVIDMF